MRISATLIIAATVATTTFCAYVPKTKQRNAAFKIDGTRAALRSLVDQFHDAVLPQKNADRLRTTLTDIIEQLETLNISDDEKGFIEDEMETTFNSILRIRKFALRTRATSQHADRELAKEVMEVSKRDMQGLEQLVNEFNRDTTMHNYTYADLKEKLNNTINEVNMYDLPDDYKTHIEHMLQTTATKVENRGYVPTLKAEPVRARPAEVNAQPISRSEQADITSKM